jgi:hypothetical protein
VKRQDRDNPSVDAGTRRNVWVSKHSFNIFSVNFDNEIPKTDEIDAQREKGAIEAVDFEFWLGIAGFAVVESDGAESAEVAIAGIVDVALAEVETDGDVGSVDSENDRGGGSVVDAQRAGDVSRAFLRSSCAASCRGPNSNGASLRVNLIR